MINFNYFLNAFKDMRNIYLLIKSAFLYKYIYNIYVIKIQNNSKFDYKLNIFSFIMYD